MQEQTLNKLGLDIIKTRHTNKDGIVYYTKGVAVQIYEVVNRSQYGIDSNLYPVIDMAHRDAYIILDIAGFEDGEPFYDRALSIPKILIKELVNNEL